jgi:hypothetical protein
MYFPPRPFCPACAARDVDVFTASGKGRLYSYVIHHRPVPGFTPPYAIAVVELEEGPRLMTNITGRPQTPEALQLDMPVEVAFEKLDDEITLPLWAAKNPRATFGAVFKILGARISVCHGGGSTSAAPGTITCRMGRRE